MAVTGFGMHILIEADYVDGMSVENHGEMRCFKYPRTDSDPSGSSVTIRMATSMISAQQAAVSLHRELPKTKTFDEIAAIAKSTWNK